MIKRGQFERQLNNESRSIGISYELNPMQRTIGFAPAKANKSIHHLDGFINSEWASERRAPQIWVSPARTSAPLLGPFFSVLVVAPRALRPRNRRPPRTRASWIQLN